jgi:hypothetical protein
MGVRCTRKPLATIARDFRSVSEYSQGSALAGFAGLCKINHMQIAVRKFFALMPLFFGFGFIAPLIAQLLGALQIVPPFGISPIALGLGVGAPWGLYATLRGSWL